MKQREPLVVLLLGLFIPFYALYWIYVTGNDMKTKGFPAPEFSKLVKSLGVIVAGSILGSIPGATGNDMLTILGFLVMMAGIVVGLIWAVQYYLEFAAAAEQATNGKVSRTVTILLFVFIVPAAMYLIQDGLNKQSTAAGPTATNIPAKSGPTQTTAAPGPGSKPPGDPTKTI